MKEFHNRKAIYFVFIKFTFL